MKTIFKIAAIAAITALAVISCGPPEVPSIHNDYWDQYNDQFDAGKYTGRDAPSDYPSVSYSLRAYPDNFTGVKDDNTVTINFPAKADVLKKDPLTTADLNFISFWTYNAKSAEDAATNATAAAPNNTPTSLNELTGWSFDRRSGNTIHLKLPAINAGSSKIVYKLDGSAYTYSNGLKLDKDGNGVSGEKYYDDYYLTMTVSGITNSANPVTPGNKGWYVTLASSPSSSYGTTDTTTAKDYQLATIGFTPGATTLTTSDYESILKTLAPGFKVETLSNGKWSASGTGVLDDTYTPSRIIVKDFSFSHNIPYRVVFEKGSISLETSKEYFGVKQRIRVIDGSNSITENVLKKRTRLEGNPGVYINTTKRDFSDFNDGIHHPAEYRYVPNNDRPIEGYWKNGFIEDSYWVASPIPGTGHGDEGDVDYEPPQMTVRAENPNPVYVTGAFTPGTWKSDSYGNSYQTLNPPTSQPDTDKDLTGWKWNVTSSTNINNFEATDWEQKRGPMIQEPWLERFVRVTNYSHDRFEGNIVLKIQLDIPVTKTENAVTNNYYFKEIDLATFKNNFKIYSYSIYDKGDWERDTDGNIIYYDEHGIVTDAEHGSGKWLYNWVNHGLTGATDIVEIGIEKVEFKLEGLVSTTASPISGKNVIYITLDPNYRKDDKVKYFYLGEGFGYADGVTVFSSGDIWDNKGFVGYPVSGNSVGSTTEPRIF